MKKHQHPFLDLIVSVIIPSLILMKLSGPDQLGSAGALVVALAFPLLWGAFEFIKNKKWNFIAVLGLISVLLTGGIGLLHIDPQWLAVKEAAIPGIIGIAVLISARVKHPFVRTLLINPAVLDVERVRHALLDRGMLGPFEERLTRATYYLSGTFFFSSGMNFVLAKIIVKSPAGSEAFNEELGRLTLLSYPMIALPSMILMALLLVYLWRSIRSLTGLTLEDVIHKQP